MVESSPIGPEELSAYIDDELDVRARARIDDYLTAHPEEMARLAEYRRRDEAIRLIFAEIGASRTRPLTGRAPRHHDWPFARRWVAAAAAILVIVLGTAAWHYTWHYIGVIGQERTLATLDREAVTAHLLYARSTEPRQLPAIDGQRVSGRMSALLGASVNPPDLSRFHLRLVGFHELAADNGPAALLIYQSPNGEEVSCYFKRLSANSATGFRRRATPETNVVYRLEPQLGYAVAGRLALPRLQEVAAAGYQSSFDRNED